MKFNRKRKCSSDNVRKEPPLRLNPFEVHINRPKHQVLGRQLKSDRGLPGISKNKALIKRKKTLLQEYKIRGKSNQFIDQRVGERNKNMTEDDKIMARFTAERMRVFNKKAMFNLSHSEDLTHKEQTVSEIERFEDIRSDDEEDDQGRRNSGALKGKFVESAHFGGGMLTKSTQDRESLIDELINESKKRKAERQRTKEETLEATEQLDKEWKTLSTIVTSTKDTGDANNQKKDQYDIVMRELKFESHGQPSQRIKTDEEIAKEDRQHLEKLEKERLKQLREIEINKYGSHKSADDLNDGFEKFAEDLTEKDLAESGSEAESVSDAENTSEAESDQRKINEDEEGNVEEEEEENSEPEVRHLTTASNKRESEKHDTFPEHIDSVEDNEVSSVKENIEDTTEEESSDDECAMDDFSDLMPPVNDRSAHLSNHESVTASKTERVKELYPTSVQDEHHDEAQLPFVLNIPDNYESFRNLLGGRTHKQQNLIFERMIKSNHPSLETGNKKKLLKLAEYICHAVQHVHFTWESLPVLVLQFNVLKEFNKEECLKILVDNISVKLEEFITGSLQADLQVHQCVFITWYIMLFLRPQGLDVLVPVTKPALSLACRLLTLTDYLIIGILCCFLLLQDAKLSSIVYPEAITYLHNCIRSITDSKSAKEQENTESKVNTEDKTTEDFRLHVERCVCKAVLGLNVTDDHKKLYCSVMLLSGFVKVYRKYPQSKIMFRQVQQSVNKIKVDEYPPIVRKEIIELQTLLQVLSSASLPSLTKNTKKPKALRQYEPSFHAVTIGKHERGLSAEQQEEQKLLHKYKHELKGAMRELRRDRVFLANVKLKEKALSDEQRIKKVKEIFGSAAAQQGELRSLKRKK